MALLARVSGSTRQISNNRFYKFYANCVCSKLYRKAPTSFALGIQSSVSARYASSGKSPSTEKQGKYVFYEEIMSRRRDQARRSVLIQVQSENSSYELYDYCSQFGKVQEMHHYKIGDNLSFILIEFNLLSDVEAINSASTHIQVDQNLPVTSPFLWFRVVPNRVRKDFVDKDIPLKVINANVASAPDDMNMLLFKAESVSDQMTLLHNATKLNETGTRLRFLSARQIELCLSGMFSEVTVLPFGSSVNGCGKLGSDLDLVLQMHPHLKENVQSRLVYYTKASSNPDRAQTQKVMEIIANIIDHFLPGISSVKKILHARVPIIKFNQTLTNLECDLSMSNTTSIYMSELLYLYGELDWRVRPLIFTVRSWARYMKLTNNYPGHWITNFSLTLLVLFYLQQKQILPSLQKLIELADKNDVRIADGDVNCTFLRDISKLPQASSRNEDDLETLLTDFFIYYSNFDFTTKSISLNAGMPLPKPAESTVYIHNPFEPGLNVAKNINTQEMERLKIEARNAAWLFCSAADNNANDWGLLSLFNQKIELNVKPIRLNHTNRMVELSALFSKSKTVDGVEKHSKYTQSANANSNTVNHSVDKQRTSSKKKKSNQKQEFRR
ncbi:poly(A) RNA polymerase, mitochondrial isoform X1 [Neodiprion fabricii]|uniref:poly(A) RNA polymerase, mitochondrial isoform X1 n=1 Tax=Neodiprion fabricii TaxID=2872261 RepID=UPI001ED8DE08|nr:poly(A) RNA polymerase, mitochondrial isoform X1 [Neodiprion fabricii]